jgi:hypothetical protein
MPLELRQELIEEGQLIAADGTPVRRVEDKNHGTPAQIGEPKLGVRTAGKGEVRGWGSSRERARGGHWAIGIVL